MTLWLLRVPISLPALGRWAGERGWATRGRADSYDEGAALHHLMGETFGSGALSSFRLLVPPGKGTGSLYAYTTAEPETLRETARAAQLPETLAVLDAGRLEAKAMPQGWQTGQRLGYDLRLRPVVRLNRPLAAPDGPAFSAGAEVDVFLAEALRRHPEALTGMDGDGQPREAVYAGWLAARLAGAAEIEADARLARFSRTRVSRGKGGTRRSVEGPDAVMQGTLRVADSLAFADRLARGVGRHRAYGYGMLLLRPPGRPAPEA